MIISTEKNPVVSSRARKLGIPCVQGIKNIAEALKNYCSENKISNIGNDINDLDAMKLLGISFCTADAHPEIRKSHHMSWKPKEVKVLYENF